MNPEIKLALDEAMKQCKIEEALLKRLGPEKSLTILESVIDNKIPNGWIIK